MRSYSTPAALAGALGILVALWAPSLSGCTGEDAVLTPRSADAAAEGDGPTVEPEEAGGAQDAASDADAAFSEMNPYGIPYPTRAIGTRPRVGTNPGNVIANLKFTGYIPNATSTSGVQLADVFDPQGRTHDIVALLLSGLWDIVSEQMMVELQAGAPTRVALVSVLGEGSTREVAAKPQELPTWRLKAGVPSAWYLLDPAFAEFPVPLYSHVALPSLIILDARTMEIVYAEDGKPGQMKTVLETFRDDTKARSRAY